MSYYRNPHLQDEKRRIWDVILWKFGAYDDPYELEPPPHTFSYPSRPKTYDRALPSAMWIGHCTYWIDCKGCTFLTDPIWNNYCAPFPLRTFARISKPPFPIEALPKTDVVLISHNHYDHLDVNSVQKIHRDQPEILWILPKGLGRWFSSRGIHKYVELDWWDSFAFQGHRVTAVPTQHFSGRTLWDKNKTLWNGYVVECIHSGKKFYFVGDTGYNRFDFKQIGERFSPIDLSLIPIGTYVPRKFMGTVHCNPADAVQIHLDVGSRFSLGMHWKTFRLSDEPLDRPPYDLYLEMKKRALPFEAFLPVDIGCYVNW